MESFYVELYVFLTITEQRDRVVTRQC